MAFRVARFMLGHRWKDAGRAAISWANTLHADDDQEFLIDERRLPLRFSAAATDHYLQVDLGAGPPSVSRLVIPTGHTYNGLNLRYRGADDAAFTSGVVDMLPETAIASDALLSFDTDGAFVAQTKRYHRLDWPNSGSVAPETPEILVGDTISVETISHRAEWPDRLVPAVLVEETEARNRSFLVVGPTRRSFEIVYPPLPEDSGSGDLADLQAIYAAMQARAAFVFDPPFDSEAPLWCHAADDADRAFDWPVTVSSSVQAYAFTFPIIELAG